MGELMDDLRGAPWAMERHQEELLGIVAERDALRNELAEVKAQTARLATFIVNNIPGEPSRDGGAVDCAIRIMGEARARIEELEAAIDGAITNISTGNIVYAFERLRYVRH